MTHHHAQQNQQHPTARPATNIAPSIQVGPSTSHAA